MADGEQKYEYVAAEINRVPRRGERRDDIVTGMLNGVAKHGWRLVAVTDMSGTKMGIYERPIRESDLG